MIKPGRALREAVRKLLSGVARYRVLVIGDSHARIYLHWRFLLTLPRVNFRVCAVGGATASGLENPHSKTQAYSRFEAALNTGGYDRVLVQLGEVDTGFVVWYRASKYQASVDEMLEQALSTYCRFLEGIGHPAQLLVVSAPLPTIADGTAWGEVADQRKEVTASQKQRTELTLRFNSAVEVFCRNHGIDYLNLDAESLGSDGIVRRDLLHSNPRDHHYSPHRYISMLSQHLAERFPN